MIKRTFLSCAVTAFLLQVTAGISTSKAQSAGSAQLSSLSDEFNEAGSLSHWKNFHETEGWPSKIEKLDVNTTSKGHLYLQPKSSGWYADWNAPFVYKEVTGDFDLVTRVKVSGKNSEVPQAGWSLAGIMVRAGKSTRADDWQPNQENWLFMTTGVAEIPNEVVVETKTTGNSQSNLKLRPGKSGWLEMRVVRSGPSFIFLMRHEGEKQWEVRERFYRPLLPPTLQVGFNAYSDYMAYGELLTQNPKKVNETVPANGKPDLILLVDYIRFKPSALPKKGRFAFENPYTDHSMSNEALLKLLL